MATKCPLHQKILQSLDVKTVFCLVWFQTLLMGKEGGGGCLVVSQQEPQARASVSSTLTLMFPTRLDELRHSVFGLSAAADCRRGVLTDGGAILSQVHLRLPPSRATDFRRRMRRRSSSSSMQCSPFFSA